MSFRDALAERPLVADGAMGTMINASGIGFEKNFEGLNLTDADTIIDIHRAFVHAGADVIETNTFSATSVHLERWGLQDKVRDINAAGVTLAHRAVEGQRRQMFVAGSVGPTGARLSPLGRFTVDDAKRVFTEQLEVLLNAGVDLLIFETFSDINELEIAISAARSLGDLPIVASMSFTRDVRTLAGIQPEVAVARLRAAAVDVIGANCSTGPRGVFEVVSQYVSHADDLMFSAMPNAGYPESRGERLFFPAPPDYFADYAERFLNVGARLIGGCCGTTPDHIVGVRRAVDAWGTNERVARSPLIVRRDVIPAPSVEGQPRTESPLLRAFREQRFVTTVEMEPPKSPDTTTLEATSRLLRDAGATTLNIADTPMARMRMTGLGAAAKVQQASGLEVVLHFPVRGRNLLRVQGDLLAAHALDVRTLFVTMGDLASIGDYPQAFDHHDIVPTGLVKLIKQQFNAGLDSASSSIGQACSFVVGAAANLTPMDMAAEAKLLKRKIDFGADFALTQPVFDAERAHQFLAHFQEHYGPLELPLLCGILPLASVRHAVFLRNEVPGMSVPELLVKRMDAAGERGRETGAAIAGEMLEAMRPVVQGAYFIPAFRRYDVIADLVAATNGR